MRATIMTRNTWVEGTRAETADTMGSRVVTMDMAGRRAAARMRAMDARSVMGTRSADLHAIARYSGHEVRCK